MQANTPILARGNASHNAAKTFVGLENAVANCSKLLLVHAYLAACKKLLLFVAAPSIHARP
jgi:hypothetical protein